MCIKPCKDEALTSFCFFKNALIYIIATEPSTRIRPILNFPTFCKNGEINKKIEFFDLAPDSR